MNARIESKPGPVKNRTTVERKSDREVVVTRTINGPARIVFEAFTRAELLKRWWVPKSMGMTLLSCEVDARVGGKYRLVFDHGGQVVSVAQKEHEQIYPKPGWVEHDANEIWEVTRRVAAEAIAVAGVAGADLAAIGITNQRETVVAWDRDSGEPIHRALVWQDRRTADRCAELKKAGHEDLIRERTGLVIDPYFSGTKIEWMLRDPALRLIVCTYADAPSVRCTRPTFTRDSASAASCRPAAGSWPSPARTRTTTT